jgi:hypothetical protein
VAEIKRAYREVSSRRRASEAPEPLPDPSPEEKERTLALMRAYMAKVGRPMVEERNAVSDFDPDRNGHDPDGDIPF